MTLILILERRDLREQIPLWVSKTRLIAARHSESGLGRETRISAGKAVCLMALSPARFGEVEVVEKIFEASYPS